MNNRTERRPNSRIRRLALAAVSAFALTWAAPAGAIDVECLNCNTLTQSLVSYAKQLAQYFFFIDKVKTEIYTYLNLIQNSVNLPNTVFQDATADINRLTNLANGASLLSGNTGAFIGNLSAAGYPVSVLNNPAQEIINEQNAIANAMQALGNVLNLQPSQLSNYSATFNALAQQASSSTGWQQTQQTIGHAIAATGQAIQTSQANVTTGLQAIAAYDLAQADRQAAAIAQAQQFGTFTPDPTSGYQGF